MKKISFLLLIITTVMITMNGCNNDDNYEFNEYTNPVIANPVNTIDWLTATKNEVKQWVKESDIEQVLQSYPDIIWGAYIKSYTYEEQDYYEVRYGGVGVKNGLKFNIMNFNSKIFDSQGNLCLSVVGGDVINTEPGYEHLSIFWNIATFKSLLWEYKTTN